ncbi:ABC transporter ATP-binding protein [Promicromonospora sukumoe]|uniref:ABC-type multidrug transport system ATPase subunit n=1 Tax=Promicromonospora sukumoe TaxID=88382 RepID=A0A7W3PCW3_9MICO|nr:ABC transporter ATP-binding protein [Promicromonospora sukumoe]MBA8806879.1 ABC-type multidrug transport system ATPase subunit [Promicromonospora sukumoe]
MTHLELSDLVVGYGGNAVCAPVNLTLGAGDIVAVIGANGTGKSTLLRTVLGLQEPLSGRASAFGWPVDERERRFRARVAGVLDDDAFFPGVTVREHLVLTARGHGVPDAGAVTDRVLDHVGITGHGGAMPHTLSSGQRRRFLLASALVRPRDLLVLDEPEQRLDTAMRARLGETLRAEADVGTAVLFATHDDRLLAASGASAVLLSDEDAVLLEPAEAPGVLAGFR